MYAVLKKGFTAVLCIWLFACTSPSGLSYETFYQSEFFKSVQLSGAFEDSKVLVDAVPKLPLSKVVELSENQAVDSVFVNQLIKENFTFSSPVPANRYTGTAEGLEDYISSQWTHLTHTPGTSPDRSSLLSLPYPYVVSGGRFSEMYYWESYFIMLGLTASGEHELVQNTVDNFAFLIDSLGYIPSGNRTYYLGRTQPPFFSLMVSHLASQDRSLFMRYLPQMTKEYDFWMKGQGELSPDKQANRRVVWLEDSVVLNRYWSELAFPRPEAYKADYELVQSDPELSDEVYRHIRAGAESGWDGSSRWLKDQNNPGSIHTTDIVPIDLNALLYHLELMIAQAYNWAGDVEQSKLFLLKADARKRAIHRYLWNEQTGYFMDYDFKAGAPTGVLSLAGMYPLFFRLSTKAQARKVVRHIENRFLSSGGFVTTLNDTGLSWDAPNGWAPLQWITIHGLYHYGFYALGNEGARRWLSRNEQVYSTTAKMQEKYHVTDSALQNSEVNLPRAGFAWTHGVALALQQILNDEKKIDDMTIHKN